MPAGLEGNANADVGSLQACSFLRLRGPGVERVVPLVPLPVPDLLDLPSVPAYMVEATEAGDGSSAEGQPLGSEAARDVIRAGARDRSVRELVIEERAYYPVTYTYAGGRFTAVIAAGAGTVLAHRRPVRTEVVGERLLAVGVLGLLFAEAVFMPGMTAKVAAVGLTTAGLYPALRWLVATRL
jgi:hypothetical protein